LSCACAEANAASTDAAIRVRSMAVSPFGDSR
jgi:hypothetical protein